MEIVSSLFYRSVHTETSLKTVPNQRPFRASDKIADYARKL